MRLKRCKACHKNKSMLEFVVTKCGLESAYCLSCIRKRIRFYDKDPFDSMKEYRWAFAPPIA